MTLNVLPNHLEAVLDEVVQLRQGNDDDLLKAIALLQELLRGGDLEPEFRQRAVRLLAMSLDNLGREGEAIPLYVEYLSCVEENHPHFREVSLYLASSHLNQFLRIMSGLVHNQFDEVHQGIAQRLGAVYSFLTREGSQ